MNNNPLAGYFRKPAIHMTLPSGGNFYPLGSLEMPPTRELPVYSMTGLDEITYKTPDALFNGSAIIDVIKSCIPSIKDPWAIPGVDLTAILVNIRIASFGHAMDVDTICPKCQEQSTYQIDLRQVIDSLESPDYANSLDMGDIKVFLKPLSYYEVNENNKLNFEDQQLNKIISSTEMDKDEKIKAMSNAFKKLSKYTIETIAKNIAVIRVPDAEVTEHEYILDFLKNCEREVYKGIKDQIVGNRKITELKPLHITCDNKECKHKYEQPFTMDMTTFFG